MFKKLWANRIGNQDNWTAAQWESHLLKNAYSSSEKADIIAMFARQEETASSK